MAVRNEAVRLTLDGSDFTTGMAKAASSTALLNRELNNLDGTSVKASGGTKKVTRDVDAMGSSLRKTEKQIDSVSGRLGLLAEAGLVLGPALIPLGAVAAPAIAGLAAGLGAAAIGAGAVVLAFQGFGGALEKVNAAALEPTAENLAAAREAMAELTPAAREAVRAVQGLRPTFEALKDSAASGFFPGFTESLDVIEQRAPELERIVSNLSGVMGDLLAGGANELSKDEWDEFFNWVATDARDNLVQFGTAVGNVTGGLAQLVVSTDELNDMGLDSLVDATAAFKDWATALDDTQGYQEFVDYVRENGPQLGETLAAVGDAFLQIIEAAAPLGGPTLQMIEAFARVVAAVADSDIGTPIMAGVSALLLLNRAAAVTTKLMGGGAASGGMFAGLTSTKGGIKSFGADLRTVSGSVVAFGRDTEKVNAATGRLKGTLGGVGKTAAGVAGVGLAASGVADGFGLANTAMLGLTGAAFGPWGAGIGAAAGFAMDLAGGFGSSAREAELAGAKIEQVNAAAQGFAATMSDGVFTRGSRAFLYEEFDSAAGAIDAAGGSLKDFATEVKGGKSATEAMASQLNITMAQLGELQDLAASGDIVDAAKLAAYGAGLGMTGDQLKAFLANLEGVDAGQKAATESTEANKRALDDQRDSMSGSERAAADLVETLSRLKGILSDRESLSAYEASLDALQAKMGAKNWDVGTDEGRENFGLLADSVRDTMTRFEELSEAGKNVAAQKFLTRAIGDLEDFGRKTPAAKGQVSELLGQLKGVDKEFLATLGITGAEVALAKIHGIEEALRIINGTVARAEVVTTERTVKAATGRNIHVSSGRGGTGGLSKHATGGLISGPGTGTSDDVPIMASNGEFMQQYAAVQYYGLPFMEAVNRRALPKLQGYATGGLIGGSAGAIGNGFAGLSNSGPLGLLSMTLKELTREVKRQTKATEKATNARDAIESRADSLASTVAGKYKSELFNQDRTPFVGQRVDPLAILRNDSANIREQIALQDKARSAGITGGAFDELASKATPAQMKQLLADPSFGRKFRAEYDQRERLANRAGGQASKSAYGAELAVANRKLHAMERSLAQIEKRAERAERDRKEAAKDRKSAPAKTGAAAGRATNGSANRGRSDVRK